MNTIVVATICLFVMNFANAAAPAKNDRIALVIGNGAYREGPLANPVNDATDVADVLRRLGFQVTLRTNVNGAQMRVAVRDFGDALRRGDVGLFYFAGHGIESKGMNLPSKPGIRQLVPGGFSINGNWARFSRPVSWHSRAFDQSMRLICALNFLVLFSERPLSNIET